MNMHKNARLTPLGRERHIRTKPYTPKTNGKAERFIQSALREWAYHAPTTHRITAQQTCRSGHISTIGTDRTRR